MILDFVFVLVMVFVLGKNKVLGKDLADKFNIEIEIAILKWRLLMVIC